MDDDTIWSQKQRLYMLDIINKKKGRDPTGFRRPVEHIAKDAEACVAIKWVYASGAPYQFAVDMFTAVYRYEEWLKSPRLAKVEEPTWVDDISADGVHLVMMVYNLGIPLKRVLRLIKHVYNYDSDPETIGRADRFEVHIS